MKKLLFIYNPQAGKGQVRPQLAAILDAFSKAGYLTSAWPTQGPGDATRVAAAIGRRYDRVVCCGGDGTLNEVVTGLMGLEAPPLVGYIPAGTTNDFSRNLVYGLSLLEKFRGMGVRKLYMIFSLTDETYALLSSARVPERVDPHDYYFAVAVLDHSYWILGSVIGSVAGALIQFDTTGIDFAMTALFLVIAVDQWNTYRSHLPALLGAGITVVSLVVMGAANMLIPALCVIIAALLALRVKLDRDPSVEKEAV